MVKTRFAPSPTGDLHLGGARTALYAWLFARHTGGKFVLRIEDTDRERSTEASIKAIFDGLHWLGIDWDEGPFYQTQRFDRYQEVISQLLNEDKAYRCYCSKERIQKVREDQLAAKEKPRYDGHCRKLHLSHRDEPYVVRFKNPTDGQVVVEDQVYGNVTFNNSELDDLVILRSDGTPTYNFCVVVDDWDMNITHVIRGDDHINNTPRQINILLALNAPVPDYAHLPMILGQDGKKMSKRQGAMNVTSYRDNGFLPEAVLNYLVRLGWSHRNQEIFSVPEMIDLFQLRHLSRSPAIFNMEKMNWLNQHYMKTLSPIEVCKHLSWHMRKLHIDLKNGPPLEDVVTALRERATDLQDLANKSRYFYENLIHYEHHAATKFLTVDALPLLKKIYSELDALNHWNREQLATIIQQFLIAEQIKMVQIAQPIRVAVTGDVFSPSIDVTLALLGKAKTLQRIGKAIEYIQNQNN